MNLRLKRAIGAAGIAVGFLLGQGNPTGASELTQHPVASAAKHGNAVGIAALGDTADRITHGNLGEVETSTGVQATTGGSQHSGSSGSAVTSGKSRVSFGDSEVRIAHAASGRLGEVQQPEPTINRARGMVTRLVTKATKLSARGRRDAPKATRALAGTLGEGQGRLLEVLDGAEDGVGSTSSSATLQVGRAPRGRELTIGVKVSGRARLWTPKAVALEAKARTEVHQGQVGLERIA